MIVLDWSAAVRAIARAEVAAELHARLDGLQVIHVPHLIDVEVLSALRRMVAAGELTVDRAVEARLDFVSLPIRRYPHLGLLDRMWALRDNLSATDATFVALAELLELPLVTADAHLARAPGNEAVIELFGPG